MDLNKPGNCSLFPIELLLPLLHLRVSVRPTMGLVHSASVILFQPFRFYEKCTTYFRRYTKDQFIEWKTTLQFTERYPDFIIALPGYIQTINIDELSIGMKTKYIYVDWLEPPKIQTILTKNVNAPIFKDFPPYKKHTYVGQTTRHRYYFVKYVLPENNSCDNLCEQVTFLNDKYGYDYKEQRKTLIVLKVLLRNQRVFHG